MIVICLDDSNQEEMNNLRLQAMFKGFGNNYLFIYIISKDFYELPKKTIRAKGNINQIFKPNNYRDVQNLYQDKASTEMTLNEFKLLTSSCCDERYPPLTIDMTKNKNTRRNRLALVSHIVPHRNPFWTI